MTMRYDAAQLIRERDIYRQQVEQMTRERDNYRDLYHQATRENAELFRKVQELRRRQNEENDAKTQ
jgi:hypothetical protein